MKRYWWPLLGIAAISIGACSDNSASTAGDGGPNGRNDLSGSISDDAGGGTDDGGGPVGQSCATGASCPGGQQCVNGVCLCPPYQAFCGGQCIPVANDAKNCGACGVQCTGATACSSGKCSSTCQPGLSICSNACVDRANDNDNCGTCGHKCAMGTGCVGGSCVPAANLGTPPGGCVNGGPPITLPTVVGSGACAGNLAQTTFDWALCSCTNVGLSDSFFTDAFDSTQGPYMPGGIGGGVGLDGSLNSSSGMTIGGTLWASAATGISTSASATVKGELHVGGPVSATINVSGDAYIKGNVSGGVHIAKTLYHPGGKTGVAGTYGAIMDVPVDVKPPCAACPLQPAGAIPVAMMVLARKTSNDNASIGLDAAIFSKPNPPRRLDLPCGSYYLNSIENSESLTIYAHGHVALFVGGSISTSNDLTLTLAPDATFDIFVGGTINTSASLVIGSLNYPALTRVYVGGNGTVSFSSGVTLAGNLYAAAANVNWSAGADIYGSVYAGSFDASSSVRIHYDRQVVQAGQGCPPPAPSGSDGGTTTTTDAGGIPPSGCNSCTDCNNQACIMNMCSACTDSSQCCAPLVCSNGSCGLIIK
jgi:hypothetical protein